VDFVSPFLSLVATKLITYAYSHITRPFRWIYNL